MIESPPVTAGSGVCYFFVKKLVIAFTPFGRATACFLTDSAFFAGSPRPRYGRRPSGARERRRVAGRTFLPYSRACVRSSSSACCCHEGRDAAAPDRGTSRASLHSRGSSATRARRLPCRPLRIAPAALAEAWHELVLKGVAHHLDRRLQEVALVQRRRICARGWTARSTAQAG